MTRAAYTMLVPVAAAACAAAALGVWLQTEPPELPVRVPGRDRSERAAPVEPEVDLRGGFARGQAQPADLPGAWPGFRGPTRDNVVQSGAPVAAPWPAGGPRVLWSVPMGEGYAGPAVLGGRVYVLDYDRDHRADVLRCLSLADGGEIWRRWYHVRVKRNHGMSRTVPAVTDKYVVSLGPKCHVLCADAQTGQFVWGMDLVRRYGTKVPLWYAGQCPLIDGDRVILAPGGSALLIAVDCATGNVVWETPNPEGWGMSHCSVAPMALGGRQTYVYVAGGGVAGVDAEDGRILWKTSEWDLRIPIATAVPVGADRVFLSGGYNSGAMMLRLVERGGRTEAEVAFRLAPSVFGSAQQTPVLYDGHLYGVRPDGEMVCLGLDGKVLWTSGPSARFGLGPYLVAGGLLYAMSDDGVLVAAEATPAGWRPLAEAKVLSGPEAWGPMAPAGGRLIVRDFTRMACLDVFGAGEVE